jgi:endoglycosylceramidase
VSEAPLGQAGRWFTDRSGRVVVLHGFNLVNKLPPYDPGAIGFGPEHAAFIRRHGFNTVRLGLIWKAVEPEPGRYDDAYLDRIRAAVDQLGAEGILVLLDFHQDMLNERYNGQGFPDWAALDDGIPARPDVGFPGNYLVMRALWRAYDHFWSNDAGPGGVGLQDRYAAAWRHVAERFNDHPAVFGYDIFNEPFPGSQALRCAWPLGSRAFDERLTQFSRRVARAIREVDEGRLVFYEPNVLFDYGSDTHHGDLRNAPAGLSFHAYCLAASPGMPALRGRVQDVACRAQEQRVFTLAERQSHRHGEGLLLSEFGATDDLGTIHRVAGLADRNMVSWQYWAYWNRDPSAERPYEGLLHRLSAPPEGANVKRDKLAALARPFPRAVAGTPTGFRFDPATRTLELSYSTAPPDGGGSEPRKPGKAGEAGEAVTELFAGHLHYPRGYEVETTGATVTSGEGERIVRLEPLPGATEARVRLTPR